MKQYIEKFIKDNSITFYEGERNTNLTVVCGYALYKGAKTYTEVLDGIPEKFSTSLELKDECERVFRYANDKNYGKWWESENAKNTWKF